MEALENSNVSSNKCLCKTIMASKPNQAQVTTFNPQVNTIVEHIHNVVNDLIRSFDLKNERMIEKKHLKEEDDPFDYFLPHNTKGNIR
jgi:hypothetical protein